MASVTPGHYNTAVFLSSTAFVFLNFALPIHADGMGMSAVAIGGMYTVFTATMLLMRPVVGYCLDHFGRRRFFTAAFLFYCAAMLAFSYSTDMFHFYVARFLQGIGASLMWVTARTMIADLHDAQGRGKAMGRLTMAGVRGSMIGAVYGFTLIGFMPLAEAWQIAFAGYAAAALVAFAWSVWRVEETRPVSRDPVPAIGTRFMTVGLWRIFFIVFLSAFASTLIEPIYLLYLKHKFDVGVTLLAAMFLPAGLVFAIVPGYAGSWSDRVGRGPVIAIGVCFAGLVSMVLPFWPALWMVGLSYILFSLGWAMASPAEEALVADLAPESLRGRVNGAKEAASGIGAATGPLVGGVIYEYVSEPAAFVTNGFLLLCAALLAWFWFAAPAPSPHPPPAD